MASKDPKSQQGTAEKRKHVALTMPQKLEIGGLKVESQKEVMAQNNTAASTTHDVKGQRDKLQSLMASNETVKGLTMRKISEKPKLVQSDKVF